MVMGDMAMNTDLLIIGGGPGGYGAAFRAADLGLDVIMVDPLPRPGGFYLHNGCIPSKIFLHLTECIVDARQVRKMGIAFGEPTIHLAAIRAWKDQVVTTMADGLATLAKKRGVLLVSGRAVFDSATSVRITGADISGVRFKHCIIATGSKPLELPGTLPNPGGRIMDSSAALTLPGIPEKLLVVGGGSVGLELGSIYGVLGSQVTLVECKDRLLSQVDADLVQPVQDRLSRLFVDILLGVQVDALQEQDKGVTVRWLRKGKIEQHRFDRAVVAIGRTPNSRDLGLEHTAVQLDTHGFIQINAQQQTADGHIFAVGDVTRGLMLAHKATRAGRVAAEVISGINSGFDARVLPAVVYTDPQISWCGLTEQQAAAENIACSVLKFPWKYSGRAQTMGMTDGFTKLLTNPQSGRILGAGITGRNAENLIGEMALAIEMGALAEDLALTIHAHPSLAETEAEAAEIFQGSPTHMLPSTG